MLLVNAMDGPADRMTQPTNWPTMAGPVSAVMAWVDFCIILKYYQMIFLQIKFTQVIETTKRKVFRAFKTFLLSFIYL